MAYVDIPKDLDGIKNKIMLGLTKRQLIGFGIAAVIGLPVFLTTRVAVGNDLGLFLMMASMALPLLYAIYEPKGMTVEQMVSAWLRFQFVAIGPRPYHNMNFYDAFTNSKSIAKRYHNYSLLILNSQLDSEVTGTHAKKQNTASKKAGCASRRPA